MNKRLLRFAAAASCLTGLVATTGCGSTVGGWAGPSEVDVRTVDVGNYDVVPLDIHVDFRPGFVNAPAAAGMRLADNVVTPDRIDPHLTVQGKSSTFAAGFVPDALGDNDRMSDAAKRNKMVYGFSTAGSDKDANWGFLGWPKPSKPNATIVALSVMQFEDPAAAAKAATDLYNTDFDTYKDKNQPVKVSKYPEAHAHWQPGTASLRSFLAHGPWVVSVLALTPSAELGSLTGLTERTLDTEFPVLDQLPPLSPEETLTLPWDPHYLLSRALNTSQTGRPQFDDDNGVFGPNGILHYMSDRKIAAQSAAALEAEEFAKTSDALVVRTADATSAKKALTDRITFEGGGPAVDAVPKIPDSTCVENSTKGSSLNGPKRYSCLVVYRNYVGYVTSNQLVDVHQRAAAQYALFANSQWQP
ncbi:DUF7373 family lipoprotein [Nocardia spumae]|uniref:DUF7373 family lipoprotein n=1 Tax=Nocardia spumae TaxID=2887190 RepID=UPI001D156ABA|nr:hypothetical protein [Nocardia spumae]